MEQKTLVIFDVDDTLLNSMRMDSQSFATTFENRYGQALPTIDWSTYPHVTDTTIFNTAYSRVHGQDPSKDEVIEFRKQFVIHASYADNKVTREAILTESQDLALAVHGNLRTVYLGDAIWDIRTTRNLNMDFIGIRHRGDAEVLESQGATQVISDYRNVQGFLQMVDQATPPLSI